MIGNKLRSQYYLYKIYNNLTQSGLSAARRAGNISGDILHIGLSASISWGTGALVAMIPIVGPFIAPFVAYAVGYLFDTLWYGDNFLGIQGWNIKPNGKSIDEHVSDFFTWVWGGFK